MLTAELADKLIILGTRMLNLQTEEGYLLIGVRICQIITQKEPFGALIEFHFSGTPKTAQQTARELRELDPKGEVQVSYKRPGDMSHSYFSISKVTSSNQSHSVTIHLGEFLSG